MIGLTQRGLLAMYAGRAGLQSRDYAVLVVRLATDIWFGPRSLIEFR